jgi:myo-inositol-1(or 4)-monophosphatase
VTWILDPLDGTTNLVHGYPQYAVAVGVLVDGVRRLGVVLDSANDHLYVGAVGQGASCDGHTLAASSRRELKASLIGTGFLPNDDVRILQAEILKTILPRARDVRRSGSPSLDFCAVASGSLDAYYEFGLGPWDICAGAAIAEAAGAVVLTLEPELLPGPLVIAGSSAVVEALADVLSSSVRKLCAERS